jgi:DNA-binding MarR family transcriptional regulator
VIAAPVAAGRAPVRTGRARAHWEAYVAIVQTSEFLQRGFAELFKAHDLSLTQYNVLRILRGVGPEGATCGDVAGNLIQHDPDVTRLLDRLDRRGLIERARDTKDRRVVRTRITEAGLAVLAELDAPVEALHKQQLGHLSESKLAVLAETLGEVQAR